jgi:alpha-tubulin suppressor-like RCC1 family protein
MPTLVEGLKKEQVVHAATGKAHSVFVTAKGQVWAAGDNKFGCVGPSVQKKKVRSRW